MEIRRRMLESIWRVRGKDYKLTSTCSTQKRRKIQSRDKYILLEEFYLRNKKENGNQLHFY